MTREDVIEILERFVIGANSCSQREIVDACASAYRMLKEKPSLPSNLDEATEEYASDEMMGGLAERAFKAGAEWMAKQGVTISGFITGCDDHLGLETEDYLPIDSPFDDMEDVIVQIRKK